MDTLFLSLFSGFNISFAILTFSIWLRNKSQKVYLYFGVFSFFSGLYFLFKALSTSLEINIQWLVILCAGTYYAIFPWFVFEFIQRKTHKILWLLSSIFALAVLVFIIEPSDDQIPLWQKIAHIGLIGLMIITIYASFKLKKDEKPEANEFIFLTTVFVLLGTEEIVSLYSGNQFLLKYVRSTFLLDIYPILFTVAIGVRLSSDFYYKSKVELEVLKNALSEKRLQLKEIERIRLQDELYYNKRDLTDFGIEINRKREYAEKILGKLIDLKDNSASNPDEINEIIKYAKSQLQIGKSIDYFHKNVHKVNHQFMSKLKDSYPSLSNNELHLASLLRLNLNTKEIATIKNITPDSVKVLRYRLRKKFNLQKGTSLTAFLIDF